LVFAHLVQWYFFSLQKCIHIYKTLPNIDAILAGANIAVPQEPSTLYALTAALIERYESIDQAKNLFEFSKSLPIEFAIILIKDLIVKDQEIVTLDQFEEWLEQYGEYIV